METSSLMMVSSSRPHLPPKPPAPMESETTTADGSSINRSSSASDSSHTIREAPRPRMEVPPILSRRSSPGPRRGSLNGGSPRNTASAASSRAVTPKAAASPGRLVRDVPRPYRVLQNAAAKMAMVVRPGSTVSVQTSEQSERFSLREDEEDEMPGGVDERRLGDATMAAAKGKGKAREIVEHTHPSNAMDEDVKEEEEELFQMFDDTPNDDGVEEDEPLYSDLESDNDGEEIEYLDAEYTRYKTYAIRRVNGRGVSSFEKIAGRKPKQQKVGADEFPRLEQYFSYAVNLNTARSSELPVRQVTEPITRGGGGTAGRRKGIARRAGVTGTQFCFVKR
ncbi:hypothetical protein FRC03_011101 [Tulasnella sp. 419]|nr:hypothetical protein FRC03_011101 [Tulasnella sp. 419]